MRYAFQVSLVFSLAGNVIEFLLGRKMNDLKRKTPKGKTDTSSLAVVKKPNASLRRLPDRYRATCLLVFIPIVFLYFFCSNSFGWIFFVRCNCIVIRFNAYRLTWH